MRDEKRTGNGAWYRFWVVHDPVTARSEVGDCCFETDLEELANQVRGGFDPAKVHTNAVVYTSATAARDDAGRRIAARVAYEKALAAARGE